MKSGTKGVVAYKGKLLLILRDNKPDIPFPNTWEYIGGGVDENETLEHAGLREIEEEIGVRPGNYVYLGSEKYPGREAGRFISILTEDEFQNINFGEEGQRYKFFSLDEAMELEMAPNLKTFLRVNYEVLKEILEKGLDVEPEKFRLTDNFNE